MSRRTKIVATMGPATDDPKMLDKIIEAGVDVVRINFSHGTAQEHLDRVERLRNRARAHGRQVGVLADLQGPKIRVERFKNGKVVLEEGKPFILDAKLPVDDGDETRVGLSYKTLPEDVKRGDTLLLDDGRIVLWVDQVHGPEIHCRVVVGGILSNRKGINRQGGGLTAPALTDKDREDIKTAAAMQADYVALSFPRSAADVNETRDLLRAAGGYGAIVAKIERAEALPVIEEIIAASDVIMIARGDLGVEIGDAALPPVQKHLIQLARKMNRVVITATQMMESMIENPIPTRAEVFDVANAVLDGTDAVMLSAETAAGKYPVEVIEAMSRVCLEAEKSSEIGLDREMLNRVFSRIDQSIAMAAIWTAYHLKVKAIASLTQTGSTALWMSRLNAGVPIYALTPEVTARNLMTLYREVHPLLMSQTHQDRDVLLWEAEQVLLEQGVVDYGDLIVLTIGEPIGASGGTNTLKIVRVGEHHRPGTLDDRL